jgi:hypothetical protein
MKYLKKFNESVHDDKVEELKEFCNSSLLYLLDDGYSIDYDNSWLSIGGYIDITLSKKVSTGRYSTLPFNWIDVKYDYIPFLESLTKKYEIKGGTTISNPEYVEVLFDMRNIRNLKYTVKNILDDDLKNIPTTYSKITWEEHENINITNKQMQNRYKKFAIDSISIKVKI